MFTVQKRRVWQIEVVCFRRTLRTFYARLLRPSCPCNRVVSDCAEEFCRTSEIDVNEYHGRYCATLWLSSRGAAYVQRIIKFWRAENAFSRVRQPCIGADFLLFSGCNFSCQCRGYNSLPTGRTGYTVAVFWLGSLLLMYCSCRLSFFWENKRLTPLC